MFDRTEKGLWWDVAWNPVTGCAPVSDGCAHCWARAQIRSGRTPAVHGSTDFSEVRFHPDRLEAPLKWRKPRAVFVCNMGDLWHPDVEPIHRALVFNMIMKCPRHTFILLTKRAKEMYDDLTNNTMMRGFASMPNVIGMVTVENQAAADERIPYLLRIPFALRGVSVEPMLGPVDLGRGLILSIHDSLVKGMDRLDWVICGCESGTKRRPCHVDWVLPLKDQCVAEGVPFFLKQLEMGFYRPSVAKMPMLEGRVWDQVPEITL